LAAGGEGVATPEWVSELAKEVEEAAASAAAGRRQPNWSARIVSYAQDILVGRLNGRVESDRRAGCRLTLLAQVGGGGPLAVSDLVILAQGPRTIRSAFEQAFDRAEARASSLRPPSSGSHPVVLAAGVAGIVVHELVGHALEADTVAAGESWIAGDDLPRGPRPITVVDDPRQGRGAWAVDDEGTVARRTVLVDRGRKAGMLVDRGAALRLGIESTGHGRRSTYLDPIRPRMGCTYIEAGDDDPSDIVRETPTGLFIRRLATGHTDPISGRSTFVVTDSDRIVDGRLAEPLKEFVLELDGPKCWGSIDRVGGDLQFDTCVGSCARDGQPLVVSVGAPTHRIGVVNVRP
jgi:TldD protein